MAQKLYESGRITYMRTDSVNLSTLCLAARKGHHRKPDGRIRQTANFTTKTKGAQEAHEAIRPPIMENRR
jgi:DNA topoisomerase-1